MFCVVVATALSLAMGSGWFELLVEWTNILAWNSFHSFWLSVPLPAGCSWNDGLRYTGTTLLTEFVLGWKTHDKKNTTAVPRSYLLFCILCYKKNWKCTFIYQLHFSEPKCLTSYENGCSFLALVSLFTKFSDLLYGSIQCTCNTFPVHWVVQWCKKEQPFSYELTSLWDNDARSSCSHMNVHHCETMRMAAPSCIRDNDARKSSHSHINLHHCEKFGCLHQSMHSKSITCTVYASIK